MARRILWALAWVVIALCFLATILPPFLDRIYYAGPVSDHFDGERFFNPDGDDTAGAPSGGSRAEFLWSRLTGAGQPEWPERVAVTPSPPAERPPLKAGEMRVTWVGHATALIETPGLNILTDPVWSDVAGPFGLGPGRVAAPGVRFENLPPIDLVVVSHNHYDHMDLATLKRLWERDRPAIVTSLGNDALLQSAGIPIRGEFDLNGGGVTALDWGRVAQVFAGRDYWTKVGTTTGSGVVWSPSPATTIGAAAGARTAIGRCGRPSLSTHLRARSSLPAIRDWAMASGRQRRSTLLSSQSALPSFPSAPSASAPASSAPAATSGRRMRSRSGTGWVAHGRCPSTGAPSACRARPTPPRPGCWPN